MSKHSDPTWLGILMKQRDSDSYTESHLESSLELLSSTACVGNIHWKGKANVNCISIINMLWYRKMDDTNPMSCFVSEALTIVNSIINFQTEEDSPYLNYAKQWIIESNHLKWDSTQVIIWKDTWMKINWKAKQ